ncbi:MAG: hypothetical protein HC915_21980 [Anaerolineae bacterium]|nr:hypothetical protein [Anaerolineae bacterium]
MLVKRIWIDTVDGSPHDPVSGDVDVVVELESGEVWTAHFVTLPYLTQQLEMSIAVTESQRHGHVALETPHVIVDTLEQGVIEDVVYEMLGAGTFETVFDLVIDIPGPDPQEAQPVEESPDATAL